MKAVAQKKRRHCGGRNRGKYRPLIGPYGEAWKDAAGNWHRRLTDEGKRLVAAFMEQYPHPSALLKKVFPSTYHAAGRSGLTPEEIDAACMDGVVVSAIRWEPDRGANLSTVAAWGCRAETCNAIRYRARFIGREETFTDTYHESAKANEHYQIAAPDAPELMATPEELAAVIRKADLTDSRLEVIGHRYGFLDSDMNGHGSGRKLARHLGICKERVRQLHDSAIEKMRRVVGEPAAA